MVWWAVYSEPQREFLARDELVRGALSRAGEPFLSLTSKQLSERAANCDTPVFLPFDTITEKRRVGLRWREVTTPRPLFQRYLFVRGADQATVNATRGVFAVLTCGTGTPRRVPQRQMDKLLRLAEPDGQVSAKDYTKLSTFFKGGVGSIFAFVGPLEGARGRITSVADLDTRGEVEVEFNMLGQRNVRRVPHQHIGKIVNDDLRAEAA